MPSFFSYVPVADLSGSIVTLLRSAPTEEALRAMRTYDPDQTGSSNVSAVTDTGTRDVVTNSKTNATLAAAICIVAD